MYGWKRIPDGGWLVGKPMYVSPDGKRWCAQDYDDPDGDSQNIMWFLHDDGGMIDAYDTLREAVKA